ncbi:hypothetical protein CAP35_11495 [Chitinophagaceae bacterium IBVUCB1]|nr:hypothetical protein CAP35_11495 [Chitinophagaceae bacterium IBVUCB1]
MKPSHKMSACLLRVVPLNPLAGDFPLHFAVINSHVFASDSEATSRNEGLRCVEYFATLTPALPFFLLAAKERNKEKLPRINYCVMRGGYLLNHTTTVLPS